MAWTCRSRSATGSSTVDRVVGHRLSKIYTRTGDAGDTGLGDGTRVAKDDPRIEAIGAVDELNSALGVLLADPLPGSLTDTLTRVQHSLFDLGGELSLPGRALIEDRQVDWLERRLDAFNANLPPLEDFILPGGSRSAALCHLARAVCRRAERRTACLARAGDVNPATLRYLNRLSDLLFVMARVLNREAGRPDVLWKSDAARHT